MRKSLLVPVSAQVLIVSTMLMHPRSGKADTGICCQRMDGNRDVSAKDTGTNYINEVIADIRVDSVWSVSNPNKYYYALTVLRKAPVDTAIFMDSKWEAHFPSAPRQVFDYRTESFPDSHIDSSGRWGFESGDTLKDVFALQVSDGKGRTRWHLSGLECEYLDGALPGFPIRESLSKLNRYLDSTGTYQGYFTPAVLKLGPVFRMHPGDPGILLTADTAAGAWRFRLLTGKGDCPAGCTEHTESFYRVTREGTVELISSAFVWGLCNPLGISPKPRKSMGGKRAGAGFSADGRCREGSVSGRQPRFRLRGD